jgi:hypothetical protein
MSAVSEFIVELLQGYDAAQAQEAVISKENEDAIGSFAMYAVLSSMGLSYTPGDDVNRATLSAKISADIVGGDVQFSDLFDKEQVAADVRRMAVAKASEMYGYDAGMGLAGLRDKVVSDVLASVREQVAAGEGEYLDAATDSETALRVIESPAKEGWNEPTDFSDKGEKNRERQARYRANHKKVWVER